MSDRTSLTQLRWISVVVFVRRLEPASLKPDSVENRPKTDEGDLADWEQRVGEMGGSRGDEPSLGLSEQQYNRQ